MAKILVLVVEDEKLVARMYEKALLSQDFDVKVSNSGSDGIRMAKEFKPDIIMMDIMMPGVNGIQALEAIKADPETQRIPVIMLTNLSGKNDADLAMSKGATEYWVKKDIDPSEYGDRLRTVLQRQASANLSGTSGQSDG